MTPVRYLFKAVAAIATLGLFFGGLIMAGEGVLRLVEAGTALLNHGTAHSAIAAIMAATDEFLFALVLCLMSAAIMFNFVIDLGAEGGKVLPQWLIFHDISHIKHTLVELILVFLIVDFATDIAEAEQAVNWNLMIKPAAILAIAAASRIMKS